MQTELHHALPADLQALVRRHLRLGWWSLLFFLALGIVLEILHGFKADFYLNAENETRRFMWTLAHAHGTLLALVHLAFAFTLPLLASLDFRRRKLISAALTSASVLLPGGFLIGGIFVYGGDPGLSILIVPIGAILLLIAVWLTARGVSAQPAPTVRSAPAPAITPELKRR